MGTNPALPVAENRAEISNRISLLLAQQSSFLKTLNPSSADPSRKAPKTTVNHNDDDEDLFKGMGSLPNEGVGYTRPSDGTATSDKAREDKALRGKLMGRKAGVNAQKQMLNRGKKPIESDSEDDIGRSALGKRKRPKREREQEQEQETERPEEEAGDVETKAMEISETIPNYTVDDIIAEDEPIQKKKKKRNKKKKQ